ncbi:BH0509 family protein [Bacillus sp. AFS055030]|nr:BH0509 family protein [Bacillus sp. AFS055030]
MMSREERKNMVQFLELTKGFSTEDLVFMTDADLEHLYDTAYTYMLHHSE